MERSITQATPGDGGTTGDPPPSRTARSAGRAAPAPSSEKVRLAPFVWGIALVVLCLVVYVFIQPEPPEPLHPLRLQAQAWLDGQTSIPTHVQPSATSPGNSWYQDVQPILDANGNDTGRGIIPFPPLPAWFCCRSSPSGTWPPTSSCWPRSSPRSTSGIAYWMLGYLPVRQRDPPADRAVPGPRHRPLVRGRHRQRPGSGPTSSPSAACWRPSASRSPPTARPPSRGPSQMRSPRPGVPAGPAAWRSAADGRGPRGARRAALPAWREPAPRRPPSPAWACSWSIAAAVLALAVSGRRGVLVPLVVVVAVVGGVPAALVLGAQDPEALALVDTPSWCWSSGWWSWPAFDREPVDRALTAFWDAMTRPETRQVAAGLLFGLACTARLTIVFGFPFLLLVGGGGSWLRRGLLAGAGAAVPLVALLVYTYAATRPPLQPRVRLPVPAGARIHLPQLPRGLVDQGHPLHPAEPDDHAVQHAPDHAQPRIPGRLRPALPGRRGARAVRPVLPARRSRTAVGNEHHPDQPGLSARPAGLHPGPAAQARPRDRGRRHRRRGDRLRQPHALQPGLGPVRLPFQQRLRPVRASCSWRSARAGSAATGGSWCRSWPLRSRSTCGARPGE